LEPTAASREQALLGLQDADPQVRAAAVQAIGRWGEADEALLSGLMPLLEDTSDPVKVQVAEVLPRLAGATPAVIEGLCRRLLEDDSVLVQFQAAQALSRLGPAATAAGGPLLRAAQTAEVTVREQAMRAMAMIQPPEASAAFASGLTDADGEIRKMASAGWMKAAVISEEVIPGLVEALRDPEIQVRANAAHALARLDALPVNAVPLLIACTADANDGLRINAAHALKRARGGEVREAMEHLIEDGNLRVRLIAASALLAMEPMHLKAVAVVTETLNDPIVRLRQVAFALVKSLNAGAAAFHDALQLRLEREEEPELRAAVVELVAELKIPATTQPADIGVK
jgi:HEAT repeat protein